MLEIGGIGRKQAGIQAKLAAVGGDVKRVIDARVYLLRAELLVTFHQLLLQFILLVGHRAGNDRGLAAFEPWPGQIEHVRRLHVGEGAEHLLEFGQVGESGEPAARP